MKNYFTEFLVMALAVLLVNGCTTEPPRTDTGDDDDSHHGDDDDNDNDNNDDSTGDSDDTDPIIDTGSDTGNNNGNPCLAFPYPTQCPVNSGWPCGCTNAVMVGCDDGSPCISMGGGTGACGKKCTNAQDTSCSLSNCWGILPGTPDGGGACINTQQSSIGYACILVCQMGADTAACPPGTTCQAKTADPTVKICI